MPPAGAPTPRPRRRCSCSRSSATSSAARSSPRDARPESARYTILFTDLKGSTALYRSLGDGPAFDRVAEHFRLLREAIEPEHGSLVKTIGDAVMAAFSRAGRRGARGAPCARGAAAPPLVLKAGLHTGPCIAVTLNERLDYFGSTVNVAARLAGLSQGCGVVMSDVVRADPGVGEMLAEAGLEPEGFRASLRGIEGDAVLWRVRVPS